MNLADAERLFLRILAVAALGIVIVAVIGALVASDRPRLDELGLEVANDAAAEGTVNVTWFGVSTLLFDDGETQILIDGFFSRPGLLDVLLDRPVDSDAATINYVLNEYRMRRMAAIIPLHSHFDHAFDVGAVANRSNASIIGSASTANIARGAGVPEEQIVVVERDGNEFTFGEFEVRLVPSVHAPIGWRGSIPLAGEIDEPIEKPAGVSAWREGGSYSVVIRHPEGTTIVQGSAGFVPGALDDVEADVVVIGIGMLDGLGRNHAERYWQSLVTATGASTVLPVHFDDYTMPFGTIRPLPSLIQDLERSIGWLETFRNQLDVDTRILLPRFGEPIPIYAVGTDEPGPSDETATADSEA